MNNPGSRFIGPATARQEYYFVAAAAFWLAEFFLRSAKARRFRCARRSRFCSERRVLSPLWFLFSANFVATFFLSLVSSDSLAVFFAIRIQASVSTLLMQCSLLPAVFCSLVKIFLPCQRGAIPHVDSLFHPGSHNGSHIPLS
jgi:hypothetical protein